jgi:hypothetical protein
MNGYEMPTAAAGATHRVARSSGKAELLKLIAAAKRTARIAT